MDHVDDKDKKEERQDRAEFSGDIKAGQVQVIRAADIDDELLALIMSSQYGKASE